MKTLWVHQKDTLKRLKERNELGLGILQSTGIGKTAPVIKYIQYRIKKHGAKLILCVGKVTGIHVWVENWHEWANINVMFVDLNATGVAGLRLAKQMSSAGMPVICIVSYETCRMIGRKFIKRTRKGETVNILEEVDLTVDSLDWDICACDEIHKLKTVSSKLSMYFRHKLKPKCAIRIGMTASLYTKRPLDAFAPVKFLTLDEDECFPGTSLGFKNRYAIMHPHIKGAIMAWQNLDDFAKRLSRVAILKRKEDCFDLPPVIHEVKRVIIPAKTRKLYDQLTEDMIAELENEKYVTASHIFTVMNKQLQIAGGFIFPDEDETERFPIRYDSGKGAELLDILETRESAPTLVVVQYDEEERIVYDLVCANAKALGYDKGFKPKVLNGKVSGAEKRHRLIAEAANDPVFIVKESVGCESADMRFADLMVFWSHRCNTVGYEQMLGRNDRGARTHSLSVIHLVAAKTADVRALAILNGDLSLSSKIDRDWKSLLK